MRRFLIFVFNNVFTNRILIWVKKDGFIKKYKANWSKVKIDHSKSLQENVGFSHEKNVQQAINKVHESVQKTGNQINCKVVLDIGCGVGLYLNDFKDTVAKHGTDLSQEFIDEAKKIIPTGYFVQGDFMKLQLPCKYDLIFSISVLEYIPPSQLAAFFKKINESLNPGGIVFIQYPHALSKWQTFYPDLSYIQYAPNKVEKLLSNYFQIQSHNHSFDDRKLSGQFDKIRYDKDKEKSFRNGAIIIGKKL